MFGLETMDVFGGPGDYASGNLRHVSKNLRLPSGTNVKDKEILSHNGQTSGINSGRSTLQATNVHILTQPQHTSENNEKTLTNWETPRGLVQILTGQSLETLSLPGGKPLLQKCLNPKSDINTISNDDSCTSNFPYYHRNASSFGPLAINSSQQPIRKRMVMNYLSLMGNCNNKSIPKQQVNTLTNMSSHHIQQEMSMHNENKRLHFLTPDKVIELQDTCMSKENSLYKNVPQKAIAVVMPLKQQVAGDIMQSKIFTHVNKKGLEAGSGPEQRHQQIPLKTIPSGLTSNYDVQTDNLKELFLESVFTSGDFQQVSGKHVGAKEFSTNGLVSLNNAVQADCPQVSESESIAAFQKAGNEKCHMNEEFSSCTLKSLDGVEQQSSQCEFSLQTIQAGNVEAEEQTQQLSIQRERPMPFFSIEENIQFSQIKDPCSSDCSEQHVHKSPKSTTTGPSGELSDKGSVIPVTEWSLQRLYALIIVLEHIQNKQLKDLPFSSVTQDVVNLYWNGDYENLFNASNTELYVNILKEVCLYHGKKDSVILKKIDLTSKETIDQVAAKFHILKHDDAPPKMMYQKSTWLNLSEKPPDIDDNDDEYSSLFRTSHGKSQVNDKVEKVQRNSERSEKEMTNADKKMNPEVEQHKPPSPDHKRTSGVSKDKEVRTEPLYMNHENRQINCVKEKVVQESTPLSTTISINTSANVTKCAQLELPETEDNDIVNNLITSQSCETSLQESSGNNLPAVSRRNITVEQGNMLPPLQSTVSPQLDKSAEFDPFACVQIKVLSPNKSKEVFARSPVEEEVYAKPENLIETEIKSQRQVIMELSDQMSGDEMQTEMTKDKGSESLNQVIKAQSQIESYCCIAKWFKVLGYINQGYCMCEQKAILNDDSEDDLEIVDVISDHHEVANLANAVLKPMDYSQFTSHHFTENRTLNRSDTGKKRRTHHPSYSQHTFDKSLHSSTDNVSLQLNDNGEGITTPQDNTVGKTINLALYGSSHLRQNKSIRAEGYVRKGFREIKISNNVHHPPETLNIQVSSDPSNRKKNLKQQNLSTCKKSYMSSKKCISESQLLKSKTNSDLEKNAADTSVTSHGSSAFNVVKALMLRKSKKQTHKSESTKYKRKFPSADQQRNVEQSKEMLHVTREDKIRKLKQRRKLASLNSLKRQSDVKGQRIPNGSHFKTKRKDDLNLALDFRVLPDSFNLTDSISSVGAEHPASADYCSTDKNVTAIKRPRQSAGAWCISPKKKCHLDSSAKAETSASASTFLEFKQKYKKKHQMLC